MTTSRRLPTILATTAAALLLTACGGNSGGDGGASGKPDDAKLLAFNACMRKAGLDFKDPASGGGPQRVKIPDGISPTRLQQIQRDCAKKTGGGPKPPSKAEQAKFLDQALKFSRCMRAHGIDMPDPQAQGGGIVIQKRSNGSAGSSGPNPDSPAFQRAQKECESFMPKGAKAGRLDSKGGGGGAPDEKPSQDGVIE
jgi:hypothetical protein